MRSIFKSCASAARLRNIYITRCNLPIYLSARSCLSHCGYMQLYVFYCIHFRPSFIRLLATVLLSLFHLFTYPFLFQRSQGTVMNYVAWPYPRYYYYSSDLQKLTRHGFAFGLLRYPRLRYTVHVYLYQSYLCHGYPRTKNRNTFASENPSLPQ